MSEPALRASAAAGQTGAVKPQERTKIELGQSLLSGIVVDYGPHELLGRFFLAADAAAKRKGIELFFAPLPSLVEVNRANSESWRHLVTVVDHRYGGIDDSNGFCILGRNRAGEIVATQAARLYTWTDTDLHEEATSLRMFHADPTRTALPGETCEVTAPYARQVKGRVVFSGGVWYRPDFRGIGLTEILPRISRAYAFTRWYSDLTIAMMGEGIVKGGTPERVGYPNLEWKVHFRGMRIGELLCALMWMDNDYLLADLARFVERSAASTADAQIERIVDKRTA